MTTNSVKKVTKRAYYNAILEIVNDAKNRALPLPEGIDFPSMIDFINHELELLDNKAAAAAKRAADKKVAGDTLREKIYDVLSDTDFKTITEIVSELGDPDVSPQMVTARLTQLIGLGQAEKDSVTVPATSEGGKSRKVSGYRRLGA